MPPCHPRRSGYVGEFSGPIVTGALKDILAPHCGSSADGVAGGVDRRCSSDTEQRGLLLVLLAISALTLFTSLVWAAASCTARRVGAGQAPHAKQRTLL